MTNQTELKTRLLKRADSRKAYACHGARTYHVAESTTGWNPPGEDGARFLESASKSGVRFVGFADEVCRKQHSRRVDHIGWYSDSFQDEKYRGVVLQIPGRNGHAIYLAARTDPWNRDCYRVDSGMFNAADYDSDDRAQLECAWRADSFAEHDAEEARELHAKDQAEAQREELAAEMHSIRVQTLALIQEAKAACARLADLPRVKESIRAAITEAACELEEKRTRRATLAENYWEAVS